MSDIFERLSGTTPSIEPDLSVIKGRAKRIQRRQRAMVSASAASIAAVALIAVLVNVQTTTPDRPNTLAQAESRDQDAVAPTAPAVADAHEDTAAEAKRSGGATGAAPAADAAAGSTTAGTSAEMYVAAEVLEAKVIASGRPLGGADFTLDVCNTGKEKVTRDFSSSQRYDFTVSSGDDVVWTWSSDRSFAMVLGTETWEPGECKMWKDTWDERKTGTYSVVGTLTSDPLVTSKPKSFCSGIC